MRNIAFYSKYAAFSYFCYIFTCFWLKIELFLVDISKENFAIHLGLYAYYEAFSLNLLSIEKFI